MSFMIDPGLNPALILGSRVLTQLSTAMVDTDTGPFDLQKIFFVSNPYKWRKQESLLFMMKLNVLSLSF